MKFFHRKFLAAFVFLGLAFNAKAVNDTLTIGQAFDWHVGDTLIYQTHDFCLYNNNGQIIVDSSNYLSPLIAILSRQDYSDSIFYGVTVNGTLTPIIVKHLTNSVVYFDGNDFQAAFGFFPVNCSTANCDTNHFISSVFGNQFGIQMGILIADYYLQFSLIKHLGLLNKHEDGQGFCGSNTGAKDLNLIYYKSDSLLWIDSANYFTTSIPEPTASPSFRLYPNPSNDEITITTETQNGAPFDAYIYDITGNCVLVHKNISNTLLNIKVISLPPGYYFLKLTDGHSLSATKGFVIAG